MGQWNGEFKTKKEGKRKLKWITYLSWDKRLKLAVKKSVPVRLIYKFSRTWELQVWAILLLLVLQVLASPLSLTHPSHAGMEEGAQKKGMNSLSLNTPPSTPRASSGITGSGWSLGLTVLLWEERKLGENPSPWKKIHTCLFNHTKEEILVSSTPSSRKGKQGRCRFIHSFKETVLVTSA